MSEGTKAKIVISGRDESRAAFASATRSLDALDASVGGVLRGLPAIAAGLATAFGVGQLKGAIDLLDTLDDIAEKSGITVESLSALRFAGETTGTSFESLTDGVRKLSRGMAEAAAGNKEWAGAFNAIGVSVRNADGSLRSADDVLLDLADRFSGYADGASKAALAQQFFGKSGAELIPILNQGGDGIRKMRGEAEELGQVFSGDLAKQAAAFNDDLVRIRLAFEGLAVSIAGPLLSTLGEFTTQLLEGRKAFGSWSEALVQLGLQSSPFDTYAQGAAKARAEIERLNEAARNVRDRAARGGRTEADSQFLDQVQTNLRAAERRLRYFESLNAKFGERTMTDREVRFGDAGYGDAASKGKPQAPVIPDASTQRQPKQVPFQGPLDVDISNLFPQTDVARAADFAAKLAKIDDLFFTGQITAQQYDGLVKGLSGSTSTAANAAETWADKQARLNDLLAATPTAEIERQRADIQLLTDALQSGALGQGAEATAKYLEAVQTRLGTLGTQAQATGEQIEATLGDSLQAALGGNFETIGDLWKNLLVKMLNDALAADIMRAFGGKSSGAGLGDLFSGLLGIFTGTRTGAKAIGGDVWPGGSFMVGERGPELFTPAIAGTITPNHQLAGVAGVTINQTINAGAGVNRNELGAAMVTARDQAVLAVSEKLRRNGRI